jgi:pimeloyl-ACP methyl ester carboxylesterase
MIQNVDLASVTIMLNDQFFDGFDLNRALQNVVCPTLLLYGEIEKGSIVRQSDVDFFHAHVRKAQTIQVKGAGHSPHWDQPMQLMQYIKKFLMNPQ